jgi:chaperonin GroES
MPKSIEPIGDRVVVKRKSAESMTPGGIALPDMSKSTPRFGTVLAVGPGALRPLADDLGDGIRFPMQTEVGDTVILPFQVDVIRLDPADETSEVVVCSEQSLVAILR